MNNDSIKTLAFLDLETLDLADTAVVWEAAVLVVKHDHSQDVEEPVSRLQSHVWALPVLDQLRLGRTFSLSTLNWADTTYGNLDDVVQSSRSTSVKAFLVELKSVLAEVDEIWVNHLDFDLPKVRSLALTYGVDSQSLWDYKKPRDFYTLLKLVKAPKVPTTKLVEHRALADCQSMYAEYTRLMKYHHGA